MSAAARLNREACVTRPRQAADARRTTLLGAAGAARTLSRRSPPRHLPFGSCLAFKAEPEKIACHGSADEHNAESRPMSKERFALSPMVSAHRAARIMMNAAFTIRRNDRLAAPLADAPAASPEGCAAWSVPLSPCGTTRPALRNPNCP